MGWRDVVLTMSEGNVARSDGQKMLITKESLRPGKRQRTRSTTSLFVETHDKGAKDDNMKGMKVFIFRPFLHTVSGDVPQKASSVGITSVGSLPLVGACSVAK